MSAWTVSYELGDEAFTGVYKVLVSIDTFLNIGQGIYIFIIFGLSSKNTLLHIQSFFKRIREKCFPKKERKESLVLQNLVLKHEWAF